MLRAHTRGEAGGKADFQFGQGVTDLMDEGSSGCDWISRGLTGELAGVQQQKALTVFSRSTFNT
jgi:hypothetical protein